MECTDGTAVGMNHGVVGMSASEHAVEEFEISR
jgi:hypothetical protein